MSERDTSIYIIQERDGAALKIGIAHDPRKRLGSIQTGNARPLFIALEKRLGGKGYARKVEYMAHTLLAANRFTGEWFGVSLPVAIQTVHDAIFYTDDFLRRAGVANDA